jgi:hypothetical protein
MQAQVRAAEGAHRQAEFARARAEAIATARCAPVPGAGTGWMLWLILPCFTLPGIL